MDHVGLSRLFVCLFVVVCVFLLLLFSVVVVFLFHVCLNPWLFDRLFVHKFISCPFVWTFCFFFLSCLNAFFVLCANFASFNFVLPSKLGGSPTTRKNFASAAVSLHIFDYIHLHTEPLVIQAAAHWRQGQSNQRTRKTATRLYLWQWRYTLIQIFVRKSNCKVCR